MECFCRLVRVRDFSFMIFLHILRAEERAGIPYFDSNVNYKN